jgi:signal transduction histidine kinase
MSIPTSFASADRRPAEEIRRQTASLSSQQVILRLLDGYPEPAVVLNHERQIVLTNDKLASLLGKPREAILGLRPGEALGCIHVVAEPGGCGTSEFCRECGAALSIVASQETGAVDIQECRITRSVADRESALDLRVWSTPFNVDGEQYTIFAVRDTTDEKRRLVLERMFFHDVLNAVGGLRSILDFWSDFSGADAREMEETARQLAEQVTEEIEAHRDLAVAERGELVPAPVPIDALDFLKKLSQVYGRHPVATRKTIAVARVQGDRRFHADEVLLRRVLGNLLKNALEASAPGETVTLSFENGAAPAFAVANPAVVTDSVRRQIFQRSFSTRSGPGRGVGTWSAKLLTERYLGGGLSFRSEPGEGTTVTVTLPATPPA